jgi:hypothetical protein
MILILTIYLLILVISCGIIVAFMVFEDAARFPDLLKYLPSYKAVGQPYLNLAPARTIRHAARIAARRHQRAP